MKKLTLLISLLALSFSSAFAHALWIETETVGRKGHVQHVKIFFGEYTTNDVSATKKWFSNLKDFDLILTGPDGTKTHLQATADSLFYNADFTPDKDGTYLLSIVHHVKDLYQQAKLQYYAFATVTIGDGTTINSLFPADASLTIRPAKLLLKPNDSASHQLIYNQAPLAKERITIISPDQGKMEVETDKDGSFNFKPTKQGSYFLEAFAEDAKPGSFEGKNYEKVWHVVTYFINIK